MLKMNFSGVFIKCFLGMKKIVFFLIFIQSVSTDDCSPTHGSLTCRCTSMSIECFGVQTDVSEVQDFLITANFSLMETVILKVTNLQFLPDFKFENTSIRYLTLGYGLRSLSSNFFGGSSSLISLNLQNNSMRNIHHELFSSLTSLKELYLDVNDPQDLTSNMFANLRKLNYLSLTRNDIHEIKPEVFQNLPVFETLILNYNNISSVENLNMISSSLTELQITHCLIEGSLEKDTFANMSNLQHLDMSYNRISEVKPHSLSSLKNLRLLNISYNAIQLLHENAFYEMNNLIELDLRGNGISEVKVTSFANLRSVKLLDLSWNNLNSILCEYTTDFLSLEKINLKNNNIKVLTHGAFYYSPNLEVMDIRGNNLECSCSLSKMALYLIENSTLKREKLENIFCFKRPMSFMPITSYTSSKCIHQDPCTKFPDNENYNVYDYSDGNSITTSTDNKSVILGSIKITSASATPYQEKGATVAITSTIVETVASSTESTLLSTMDATVTSFPELSRCFLLDLSVYNLSSDSEFTVFSNFSYDGNTFCLKWTVVGNLSDVKRCIIKYTTDSGTKSKFVKCPSVTNEIRTWSYDTQIFKYCLEIFTQSLHRLYKINRCQNNFYRTTTTYTPHTTISMNGLSQESKERSRPSDTTEYFTTILLSNISETETTVLSTSSDTTTSILSSNSEPVKFSCSLLDLSIYNSSSDSKLFTMFNNFSYDGNIFCLKWTVVGNLSAVKRCTIKYATEKFTKSVIVKCPSVSNEIQIWSHDANIFKYCLNIYAPYKISQCKNTLYGAATTYIPRPTIPMNSLGQELMEISRPSETTEYFTTILLSNISATETTVLSTSDTTTSIVSSSSEPVEFICASLNLSIYNSSSDSKFTVFNNYSYDGNIFCLKWTVVGNLSDVKRCIIKYTTDSGTKSKSVKCPSVANKIQTWSHDAKILAYCLDIYVPHKTSQCKKISNRATATYTPHTIMPIMFLFRNHWADQV